MWPTEKILEFLPLPVGGIVSDEEPEVIAAQEKKIDQAARMLGSDLPDPMMYMFIFADYGHPGLCDHGCRTG